MREENRQIGYRDLEEKRIGSVDFREHRNRKQGEQRSYGPKN